MAECYVLTDAHGFTTLTAASPTAATNEVTRLGLAAPIIVRQWNAVGAHDFKSWKRGSTFTIGEDGTWS